MENSWTPIEYTLIRTKRRTISIEIQHDGDVLVRAPLRAPKYEIDGFLESKRSWIEKHQKKIKSRIDSHNETMKLTQEELRNLVKEAKKDITSRVNYWAPIAAPGSKWDKTSPKPIYGAQISIWEFLNSSPANATQLNTFSTSTASDISKPATSSSENPPRLTVRHQKTLWGSCTTEGNLSFNCLLMLAPEEIRDYVVVHELCHLRHLNHSKEFWRAVENALPDYKSRRRWLKDNGSLILARLPE